MPDFVTRKAGARVLPKRCRSDTLLNFEGANNAVRVDLAGSSIGIVRSSLGGVLLMREFRHDVFVSFAHEDQEAAEDLRKQLERHGLRVWIYLAENRIGDDHEKKVGDALDSSQYMIVLVSRAAAGSPAVKREHDRFERHRAEDDSRQIFRLRIGEVNCPELLPPTFIHATKVSDLVAEILAFYVKRRRRDVAELTSSLQQTEQKLADREREAFGHYRRGRFWKQLVQDRNVHIFTCGRDTANSLAEGAQRPSRTTIDKWDYRTVLDITHFLNRHYPATQVTIEDPVSKLRNVDLKQKGIVHRVARLHGLLRNKTCIVVGSPDVSDFAEIVLAETHRIQPYHPERVKQRGYVIMKGGTGQDAAPSSHNWTSADNEEAGLAQVLGAGKEKLFPATFDANARTGEMHGILAVVANPFSDAPRSDRVVLLSGFSGVATNAIAKFLTDDKYLDAFGRFDRDYADVTRNVEVLIHVKFSADPTADGDSREIHHVDYQSMVEL